MAHTERLIRLPRRR